MQIWYAHFGIILQILYEIRSRIIVKPSLKFTMALSQSICS